MECMEINGLVELIRRITGWSVIEANVMKGEEFSSPLLSCYMFFGSFVSLSCPMAPSCQQCLLLLLRGHRSCTNLYESHPHHTII